MTIFNQSKSPERELARQARKIEKAGRQLDELQSRALRMLAEQQKRLNK